MKKKLLILILLLSFLEIYAQKTNLIFFTEGDEKFYVILNSVLQNDKPEKSVKVTDLITQSYKLKILFKDTTIAPIEKNLVFNQGTETTFNIKKNSDSEYVVRYFNEIPIDQALQPVAGQLVVIFSASGTSAPITTNSFNNTQTTTPSTEIGVQANLQQTQQQVYIMPGYNGPVGCPYPISPYNFTALKNTISTKSFEDSKLLIAEQLIASNCLLSLQVREIMMLFSFEDSKIQIAKYAYNYTFDIGNYFKVNDAFTFENSIGELNTYISGFKK